MENHIDTLIGTDVVVKGSLINKGSIHINGIVEGEVRSDQHVIIGNTAKINGPVYAKTIEVSGEVEGIIEAFEQLELTGTGRVIGDINAKSLIIKQGAIFVGKSTMPTPGTEITTEKKIETELPKKPAKETVDKIGFFSKK
jgi:cytoskeletal protein CcmA (bactofilin family)